MASDASHERPTRYLDPESDVTAQNPNVFEEVGKRGKREGIQANNELTQVSRVQEIINALKSADRQPADEQSLYYQFRTMERWSRCAIFLKIDSKKKSTRVTLGNYPTNGRGQLVGDEVVIPTIKLIPKAEPIRIEHVIRLAIPGFNEKKPKAVEAAPVFSEADAVNAAKQSNSALLNSDRLGALGVPSLMPTLIDEIVKNYVGAYLTEYRHEMAKSSEHPAAEAIKVKKALNSKIDAQLRSENFKAIFLFFGATEVKANIAVRAINADKDNKRIVLIALRESVAKNLTSETAAAAQSATTEASASLFGKRNEEVKAQLLGLFNKLIGEHAASRLGPLGPKALNTSELSTLLTVTGELIPMPYEIGENTDEAINAEVYILDQAQQEKTDEAERHEARKKLVATQRWLFNFATKYGEDSIKRSSDIVSGAITAFRVSGEIIREASAEDKPNEILKTLKSIVSREANRTEPEGATKKITGFISKGLRRIIRSPDSSGPRTPQVDLAKARELLMANNLIDSLRELEIAATETFDAEAARVVIVTAKDVDAAISSMHLDTPEEPIDDKSVPLYSTDEPSFTILRQQETVDKIISQAKIEAYVRVRKQVKAKVDILNELEFSIDEVVNRHTEPKFANRKRAAARELRETHPNLTEDVVRIVVEATKKSGSAIVENHSKIKNHIDAASSQSNISSAAETQTPLTDRASILKILLDKANEADEDEEEFNLELLGLDPIDEGYSEDEEEGKNNDVVPELATSETAFPPEIIDEQESFETPTAQPTSQIENPDDSLETRAGTYLSSIENAYLNEGGRLNNLGFFEYSDVPRLLELAGDNGNPILYWNEAELSLLRDWLVDKLVGKDENVTQKLHAQEVVSKLIIENETENQRLTIENIVGDDIKNSHEAGTLTIIQIRDAVRMLVERSGGTLKEDEKLIIRNWIKSGTRVIDRFDKLKMQINTLLSLSPELP